MATHPSSGYRNRFVERVDASPRGGDTVVPIDVDRQLLCRLTPNQISRYGLLAIKSFLGLTGLGCSLRSAHCAESHSFELAFSTAAKDAAKLRPATRSCVAHQEIGDNNEQIACRHIQRMRQELPTDPREYPDGWEGPIRPEIRRNYCAPRGALVLRR